MSGATNIHATACLLGDRGLLIIGPSGSGKTSLALYLIERYRLAGRFCAMVGDDQLLASVHSGRLVCHVPPQIAGLAEIRPLGPVEVAAAACAVIDLAVTLVPPDALARIEDPGEFRVGDAIVPRLNVAAHNTVNSAAAICAALDSMRRGRSIFHRLE